MAKSKVNARDGDKTAAQSNHQDDMPPIGTRSTSKGVPLVYADWKRLRDFTGGPLEAIEYLLSERTSDGAPVTCRQRLRAIAEAYGLPLAVTMGANMLWLASAKPVRYALTKQGLRIATGFDAAPLKAWDSIVDRLEGKAVQRIAVKVQHTRDPAAIRAELMSLVGSDAKFAGELAKLLGVSESDVLSPAGCNSDKSSAMPETALALPRTPVAHENAAQQHAVCSEATHKSAWELHAAEAMIDLEPFGYDEPQATESPAAASDAHGVAMGDAMQGDAGQASVLPARGTREHARDDGGGGPQRDRLDAMHVPSPRPGDFSGKSFGGESGAGAGSGSGSRLGESLSVGEGSRPLGGAGIVEEFARAVPCSVVEGSGEAGESLGVERLVLSEGERLARLAGSVSGEVVVGADDGLRDFVSGCSDASLAFLREAFQGEIRRRQLGKEARGLKRAGRVLRPGVRPVVGDE